MSDKVGRALEDSPPLAPMPGDPGTRTVELFTAKGRKVGVAAIPEASAPEVLMMGARAFVHTGSRCFYETEAARVQVHV